MREVKDINVEVGGRIKTHRLEKKLTRERLATMTGYSANFIQEDERGRSGLSSESIRAFSIALQVSSDSLLFGTEQSPEDYVLSRLKTLPSEKCEKVVYLLNAIIDCLQ